MKKNRILALSLCLAMLITVTGTSAYATLLDSKEEYASMDSIFSGDTLKMAQNDYISSVKALVSKGASPEQRIETTVKSFLTYAKASVREPKLYDCSALVSRKSMNLNTVQYRLTDYQYQSALNKAMGWAILSDDLEFSDYEVTVNGDEAKVTIVESYTYYITDGFDSESFRRKMYTFDLIADGDNWMISNVVTDDPWETDASFKYAAIDVNAEINHLLSENKATLANNVMSIDPKLAQTNTTDTTEATLNKWTYTPSKAVTYAVAHYKDTSNSTFGYYDDENNTNCQNFASQCVWAGLGGTGSSRYVRPAVSKENTSTNAFNVWCAGQSTTYYTEYRFNWAWDNACGFMKLMRASTATAEGPFGNGLYSNGVQNCNVGEVLSVDWGGSPAETAMDHAMFVTEVSGTAGSRTTSQVKVAAHTKATNSAYQTLSAYTTQSIGSFGRSYISYGYYSTTQP